MGGVLKKRSDLTAAGICGGSRARVALLAGRQWARADAGGVRGLTGEGVRFPVHSGDPDDVSTTGDIFSRVGGHRFERYPSPSSSPSSSSSLPRRCVLLLLLPPFRVGSPICAAKRSLSPSAPPSSAAGFCFSLLGFPLDRLPWQFIC